MKRILSGRGCWWWVGVVLAWGLMGSPVMGQVKWTSRKSPITAPLQDVAYGDGRFVTVAGDGTLALSTNSGVTWKKISPGLSSNLTCVTYGNGTFVAMGLGGVALTSSNGTVWQSHNTGVNFLASQIIYANGRFVTVGVNGVIMTSLDGKTWTQRFSPNNFAGLLTGVAYGGGTYVAVGASGSVFTSTDGGAWTQQVSGTGALLYGVAYGSGTFSASAGVGVVLTSVSGTSWTSAGNPLSPSSTWWERAIFGQKSFVGVGVNGNLLTSPTGHAWTQQTSGTSNQLLGIALGNNTYVTVGTNGIILTSPVASPTITKQPKAVSVAAGKTATFEVTATGAGKLTYAWTKAGAKVTNGSRISGATGPKLTIKNAKKGDEANYQVTISDSYGSVASNKVKLTVK